MGAAYAVLGVGQLIALARYGDEVDFGDPSSWIYLGFLVTVVLGGGLLAWSGSLRALASR
jgi:hypothetical protein